MVQKTGSLEPVSDDELAAAYDGPALLANKTVVSVTPAGMRLAFLETHPNLTAPVFRSAVLLPFPDAQAMISLMTTLMEQNVKFEVTKQPNANDGSEVDPKGEGNG